MKLSPRSIARLSGVHPDLQRVVYRAAELIGGEPGFIVTEGVRTKARQVALKAAGASQTLDSRHITGHAVDIAATVNGEIRWDWPLYHKLSDVMKEAAQVEGVPITWGGDWKSLRDGPHFELPRVRYP